LGPSTRKRWLEGAFEAGADHHRGATTSRAEIGDEAGDGGGRRGDDRQVGRLGEVRDLGVSLHRANRGFVRVDRHDRPHETALKQVAGQHLSHRSGPVAGPDQGHGAWLEEGIEVAGGHGSNWLVSVPAP
jgi:hypothetical protein